MAEQQRAFNPDQAAMDATNAISRETMTIFDWRTFAAVQEIIADSIRAALSHAEGFARNTPNPKNPTGFKMGDWFKLGNSPFVVIGEDDSYLYSVHPYTGGWLGVFKQEPNLNTLEHIPHPAPQVAVREYVVTSEDEDVISGIGNDLDVARECLARAQEEQPDKVWDLVAVLDQGRLATTPTAPAGEPDDSDICERVELPHVLAWADGVRGDMWTEYADRITDEEARVAQAVWAAHTGEQPVSDPDGLEPALAAEAAKHLTSWLDMDLCDCEDVCRCGRTHVRACRDRLLEAAAAPAPDEREIAALREDTERYHFLISIFGADDDDLYNAIDGAMPAEVRTGKRQPTKAEMDIALDAARLRAGKEGE